MSSVMQELLAQSSFDKLKEGSIVSGIITEIRQNEVVIDIGGKAEAVVPANEFLDLGELQIGQTIEVLLEKLEDKEATRLSPSTRPSKRRTGTTSSPSSPKAHRYRARSRQGQGRPDRQHRRRLLPAGVAHRHPAPKNLDQYVGQTYDFKVLKINLERKNIVLSRRELIEQQRADKRRNLLDSIQPGQLRKGVVKNITDSVRSSTSTAWTACCTSPT